MANLHRETIPNTNTFLTNMATGYKSMFPVADFIAPPLSVNLQAGKYTEYTKSVFRIFDDKVIGSAEPLEIQWNVDESTYACENYAMGKFVHDDRKNNATQPVNLDRDAVRFLMQFHTLAREYRINAIAGNAAIVTQTAAIAAAWAGAAGTPITDILAGISQIATSTGGYRANRIVVPLEVALAMINTTEWITRFVGTEVGFGNGLWSVIKGLNHLGLDVEITSIQGLSEYKGTASDPKTELLWSDNVLLFYCEPTPSLETRTFMYSPNVYMNQILSTRVPRRRGLYHDIFSSVDELLIDAQCAYLLTNCI